MAPKLKEIRLLLSKIQLNVEELATSIDERNHLYALGLAPSSDDNNELASLLSKTMGYFKTIQQDMLHTKDAAVNDQFDDLVKSYNEALAEMQSDPSVNVAEYQYEKPVINRVRFNDVTTTFQSYQDVSPEPQLESESALKYSPESEPQTETEGESEAELEQTNHQMFAQHQQTMMRQDQDLDLLHESITRQNRMGHDIDQELNEHLIILNDLEEGTDNSQLRMRRATTRLNKFIQTARENGSLLLNSAHDSNINRNPDAKKADRNIILFNGFIITDLPRKI
ncbi:hypothetical protein KGF56_002376 [Candida oxycetoniae]|uniref:t-SNARE coiled-coil homology domain-containing protein n=1 Tax=Candida oxycetoniae TaxID=497107 RepID=A0AAI9SXU9_9ASCO|nr:uncharacterized protein KGF56_002376 [Candida oxycetoniae]KAI3404859.2 hypothetical protein KGF56_002376 [Candida oxycetoniae]